MASKQFIVISYAGSLKGSYPKESNSFFNKIKIWFWTYKIKNVDPSTRTGFYLLKAIHILKNDYNISENELQLKMWGSIDKSNLRLAKQFDIEKYVNVTGFKTKQETVKLLKRSSLLFLPLEKGIGNKKTLFIPGKLYEYLSIKIPILALAEDSDCTDILKKSGLGIITSPDDPKEIAKTIYSILVREIILTDYSPNEEYISKFSFESKTRELANVFDNILKQ